MTTILLIIASFAAGAIASYLVLRNNPKAKRSVDRATQAAEDYVDRG